MVQYTIKNYDSRSHAANDPMLFIFLVFFLFFKGSGGIGEGGSFMITMHVRSNYPFLLLLLLLLLLVGLYTRLKKIINYKKK